MKTSLSDNKEYPDFCEKAATQDSVFDHFRRNEVFCSIVETLTYEQGLKYLQVILSQTPELVHRFDDFRKNDLYGDPVVYEYAPYGKFSPTTLRYIKVISDLIIIFGQLNNVRIVEIGGGYGGLCRIISSFFTIDSYKIVDLSQPLHLAEKYLSKYGVKNVTYATADDLAETSYDLVISNYAFSECRRSIQEHYINCIIKKSPKGYITWNFISGDVHNFDAFKIRELTDIVADATVMASKPHPFSVSRIVVWGNQKKFTPLVLFRFNFSSRIQDIRVYGLKLASRLIAVFRKALDTANQVGIFLKRRLLYPEVIAHQKKSLAFYSQFIKRRDLCFDIGANIGNKTGIFLKLGAKVVAVEPQSLYQKIEKIYGNNANLVVINKGLAATNGYMNMSVSKDTNVISTMSQKFKEKGRFSAEYESATTILVPVTTLDDLIADYGVPQFCKIDVEGFEEEVLRGLTRPIPYISFEFGKELSDDAKKCVDYLTSLGPARFNFSPEESMEFMFENWILPNELFLKLNTIENNNLWGDIYAKF